MLKFVTNSATCYKIVVDLAVASQSELFAASELSNFIGQVTGAIVPVVTKPAMVMEGRGKTNTLIAVGKSALQGWPHPAVG